MNHNNAAYVRAMPHVARELLGEPNPRLSSKTEWRFGTNGSIKVDLLEGTYKDFEGGGGGGVIKMLENMRALSASAAHQHIVDQGYTSASEITASERKPSPVKRKSSIVATYDYVDEHHNLIFQVVRFDPKDFRQRRPAEGSKWIWKVSGLPKLLYRLPETIEAVAAKRTVFILEGEKGVNAVVGIGRDATCSPGGAGKWLPEHSAEMAGVDAIIMPDNDEPGRRHAELVAKLLKGIAARIRVLPLPGIPHGGDAFDWIASGGTAEQLQQLVDALPSFDGTTGEPLAGPAEPFAQPTETAAAKPGVGAGQVSEPDEAAQQFDSETARLSWLNQIEYERCRKAAAQTLKVSVSILDRAVMAQKAKRRAEAEAKHRAQPQPEPGVVQWPLGVLSCNDGLYMDVGGDAGPLWLCAPIEVLGLGRDAAGEGWGRWLRWLDADGRVHTWPMPAKLLMVQPGELEAALVDRGLNINADPRARQHLRHALNAVTTGSRVTFVDRPGWHISEGGQRAFVLSNGEVIGPSAEKLVLKTMPEGAAFKMSVLGALESWKADIAAKAVGNPVSAFSISAAFAGPLIGPLNESSGGVHFFGGTKDGKTLSVRLGLSVLGPTGKTGLLKDWRNTANALEGAAEECHDSLLTLDEIHQAEAKDVVPAVYQLANESGKGRLEKTTALKKRRTWRIIVLSTGEVDVATMVARANPTPLPAGAELRLPSIPVDRDCLWPNLHGEASPVELMVSLQSALATQYGSPIRPYLAELTAVLSRDDGYLEQALVEIRQEFYDSLPPNTDGQVKEVARRCALIALAGELATEWKVLPWKTGEAISAAKAILKLWVDRRGGVERSEETSYIRAVRAYLSEFGNSRFVFLSRIIDERSGNTSWVERYTDRVMPSRSGWRRPYLDEEGDEYILDSDGWQKLCASCGANHIAVAKSINDAGFLTPGEGKNLAKSVRLPGVGKIRAYHIKPSIFAGHDPAVIAEAAE